MSIAKGDRSVSHPETSQETKENDAIDYYSDAYEDINFEEYAHSAITRVNKYSDIPEENKKLLEPVALSILEEKSIDFENWNSAKKERFKKRLIAHLFVGRRVPDNFYKGNLKGSGYPIVKTKARHSNRGKTLSNKVPSQLKRLQDDVFGAGNDVIFLPIDQQVSFSIIDEVNTFINWYNEASQAGKTDHKAGELNWDPHTPNKTYYFSNDGQKKNGPKLMKLLRAHDWFLYEYIESMGGMQPEVFGAKTTAEEFAENASDITGYVKSVERIFKNDILKRASAPFHTDELVENYIRTEAELNNYRLVITRNPDHILAISANQIWNSCKNILRGNDFNAIDNTRAFVKKGALVAYLAHKDDKNCSYPIMRRVLLPAYDKTTNTYAYHVDSHYGVSRGGTIANKYLTAIYAFLKNGVNKDSRDKVYCIDKKLYSENGRNFNPQKVSRFDVGQVNTFCSIDNECLGDYEEKIRSILSKQLNTQESDLNIFHNFIMHSESLTNHEKHLRNIVKDSPENIFDEKATIIVDDVRSYENCEKWQDFFEGFFERRRESRFMQRVNTHLMDCLDKGELTEKQVREAIKDHLVNLEYVLMRSNNGIPSNETYALISEIQQSRSYIRGIFESSFDRVSMNVYEDDFFRNNAFFGYEALKKNYFRQFYSDDLLTRVGLQPRKNFHKKFAQIVKKTKALSWQTKEGEKPTAINFFSVMLYRNPYMVQTANIVKKLETNGHISRDENGLYNLSPQDLIEIVSQNKSYFEVFGSAYYSPNHDDYLNTIIDKLKRIDTSKLEIEKIKSHHSDAVQNCITAHLILQTRTAEIEKISQRVYQDFRKKQTSTSPSEIIDGVKSLISRKLGQGLGEAVKRGINISYDIPYKLKTAPVKPLHPRKKHSFNM